MKPTFYAPHFEAFFQQHSLCPIIFVRILLRGAKRYLIDSRYCAKRRPKTCSHISRFTPSCDDCPSRSAHHLFQLLYQAILHTWLIRVSKIIAPRLQTSKHTSRVFLTSQCLYADSAIDFLATVVHGGLAFGESLLAFFCGGIWLLSVKSFYEES